MSESIQIESSSSSGRDPLALSDAALRLAGHDVTDEYVRQLGREIAQGHYLPTKQSLVYGVLR